MNMDEKVKLVLTVTKFYMVTLDGGIDTGKILRHDLNIKNSLRHNTYRYHVTQSTIGRIMDKFSDQGYLTRRKFSNQKFYSLTTPIQKIKFMTLCEEMEIT